MPTISIKVEVTLAVTVGKYDHDTAKSLVEAAAHDIRNALPSRVPVLDMRARTFARDQREYLFRV